MKFTRREFVKTTAAGTAGILLYKGGILRSAYAYANSPALAKFIQPMPLFTNGGIPLAARHSNQPYTGVDYYQLTAGVFRQQLHPNLPNSTRLYGYKSSGSYYAHLGGAIIAQRGRPVRYSVTSDLPVDHILPYDTTLPDLGNGGQRKDKIAVHLHGGLVPWASDGGPFHWQSNPNNAGGLMYGASYIPWLWNGALNPDLTPNLNSKVGDYFYPNLESYRFMWFHDHAVAQTRLNAYAGLATGYIVTNLAMDDGLGLPFGEPIVFQDKVFYDPANDPMYATYVPDAVAGDLWYPWQYDPAIWPIAKGGVPPVPSAVPEFFGDTMLANGVVYPFHTVDAGQYRFRLLNACNGRFLDLSFVMQNPGMPGEVVMKKNGKPLAADVDVWQIGTEGGFLPTPVPLVTAGVPNQPFILGPAERADIVVDFSRIPAGGKVILYNVAGSPFPGGAPIFDYYYGNNKLPIQIQPGFGPNTRTLLRFDVTGNAGPAITMPAAPLPVSYIPVQPDAVNGGLTVDPAYINGTQYTDPFSLKTYGYSPVPVELTLNEIVEPVGFGSTTQASGRLMALIGNTSVAAQTLLPLGAGGIEFIQAPTEFVNYNTLHIWKVYNLTADAHPMHFHVFNVQILGRQPISKYFSMKAQALAAPALPTGPARPPLPNEMGFKETVVMYPGEVTILAVLVDDPLPTTAGYGRVGGRPTVPVTTIDGTVNCPLPVSPRLQGFGVNADEYVWHCHILEHEEHDMMRPLVASDPVV